MQLSINQRDKQPYYKTNYSFKGTPKKLYFGTIRNAQNAIEAWEGLKYAKYFDVHSDKTSPSNKAIRLENYSFLDKLNSPLDKTTFIEAFCKFTGFPNLKQVSENMNQEIKSTIERIYSDDNYYKTVDYGYDPTCSLAQKKAFPGSDMDKAYVILTGEQFDDEKVSQFKGKLWDSLDQRLVSLNHPNTFPEIHTVGQVSSALSTFNAYTKLMFEETAPQTLQLARLLAAKFFFNPIPFSEKYCPEKIEQELYDKLATDKFYTAAENIMETNPTIAAKFNIDLVKYLPVFLREPAKNFAFFIEIVRANYKREPKERYNELSRPISLSNFARYSNVTQVEAWQNKLNSGYMKDKLRKRMQLEIDFYKMTTNDKYDLIKDVIKGASNDQSERFSQFFKNDDNIDDRYKELLLKLE